MKENKLKGLFSRASDDWKTPGNLYRAFMEAGFIDPCPYQATEDGLKTIYEDKKLFINPPFSKMSDWIDYAIRCWCNECAIALLIPARTDTRYFHKILQLNPDIYFIKGRLHYNESEKKNAPFPSVLIWINNFCSNQYRGYYSISLEQLINKIKENKL